MLVCGGYVGSPVMTDALAEAAHLLHPRKEDGSSDEVGAGAAQGQAWRPTHHAIVELASTVQPVPY
jgi:hypothetical protein